MGNLLIISECQKKNVCQGSQRECSSFNIAKLFNDNLKPKKLQFCEHLHIHE